MADYTITNRRTISLGHRKIATGGFTHDDSADKTIPTGLSRVETFRAWATATADGPEATYFYNTNTNSNNVAGYGGVVWVDGDASYADGETYVYEAGGI